jgi:hypothetical protein
MVQQELLKTPTSVAAVMIQSSCRVQLRHPHRFHSRHTCVAWWFTSLHIAIRLYLLGQPQICSLTSTLKVVMYNGIGLTTPRGRYGEQPCADHSGFYVVLAAGPMVTLFVTYPHFVSTKHPQIAQPRGMQHRQNIENPMRAYLSMNGSEKLR